MENTINPMFGETPEMVGEELAMIHRFVTSKLTYEQVQFLHAASNVATDGGVAKLDDIREALDWSLDQVIDSRRQLIAMHVIQMVTDGEVRLTVPNTKEYFDLVEHPAGYVDVWRR